MSEHRVTFCKYIHWKWSKEGQNKLEKSLRKKDPIHSKSIPKKLKKDENKREICNHRISQRDLLIQRKTNPYMIKNNYINDLDIQANFLRPQDSNF